MTQLLPPNATACEAALDAATARLGDVPVVQGLWNPATCPPALLPWLAWALSVDEWDDAWTDEAKRRVIAQSVSVHWRKGTVGAVKQAVANAGLGEALLVERFGVKFYNGTIPRNGTVNRERADHWAEYRVILNRRLSLQQAAMARRIIEASAPARCHLKELDFRRALNLYSGRLPRNGTYTRGAA